MTFEYVTTQLKKAKSPEDVFENITSNDSSVQRVAVHTRYKQLVGIVHPDKNGGSIESVYAMTALTGWRDKAYAKIGEGRWNQLRSDVVIKAGKTYRDVTYLTSGDICDVYIADQEGGPRSIIKIVINTKDQDLVQNEAAVIKRLWEPADKEALVFHRYLPKLLEQTKVKVDDSNKLTNIFEACVSGYTLEEIHKKHPVLDPRHVAWITKRMFEIAGWVHTQKIVHGAIVPSHIIIYPKNHGICVLDWSYAVDVTKRGPIKAISTKYKHLYPPEVFMKTPALPAVDVYMIAKCAIYLLGGNVETNSIPDSVPSLFGGVLRACVLPNNTSRYMDAWEALEQFSDNLRTLYGPRKFIELEM